MTQTFGLGTGEIGEVGVARFASLASSLMTQGTRVAGHFDPACGWTRQELLSALLVDELRAFEWGLAGRGGRPPERVTPRFQRVGDPEVHGHKMKVMSMERFDRLMGTGEVAGG